MVDVSDKAATTRMAVAQGFVKMKPLVGASSEAAEESEGEPAGSCSNCRDCGSEEDGGVDTSLSSPAADAH